MIDRSAYTDPGYDIPKDLQAIYTPCIIWALQHSQSGCWMTVREVGTKHSQTQICFFLQWRVATEYSAEPIDVPGAILMRLENEDGDTLERRAIAYARELLSEGPVAGVISAKATWDVKNPKRHKENGAQGGRARAANALEKRSATRVEAGVSSEPGAPIALSDAPVAVLENEFWEVTEDERRILYSSCEIDGVWISIELNPDGFWRVRRRFFPDGDKNKIAVSDAVRTLSPTNDGKYERYNAIATANKLALTDLKTWKRGEYNPQSS